MTKRGAVKGLALAEGSGVILYLREPKEKVWGLLISLQPAGIVVRGLDLAAFDDWMRQEARGEEQNLSPTTLFYPMHRIEKMERDESVGPIEGYGDRFVREVGRTITQALGLE